MAHTDWLTSRWQQSLRQTDRVVGWIAAHKLDLLSGSIVLAIVLLVSAAVLWIVGDGGQLNKVLVDVGGYLAVAAIVVGLPALAYAMVTDRTVDALTASEKEKMRNDVEKLLDSADKALEKWGYHVQLYTPTVDRTRLIPRVDPSGEGPKEGWVVDSRAPQGVTGSAWVANEYFCTAQTPHDLNLRLTASQQDYFRDITHVAATPVTDVTGRPIAVLTVFSKNEERRVSYEDLSSMVIGLADEVARILRAYIGPLNFERVSAGNLRVAEMGDSPPETATKDTLAGFRFPVTQNLVSKAVDSRAFSDLSKEMKRTADLAG